MRKATIAAAVAILFSSTPALAGPTDAEKCESSKLKQAGKYASCLLKADSKGVKKGELPDYTKCNDKFDDKWAKTETKAGAMVCPSEGDMVSISERIATQEGVIADFLSGGSPVDPYSPASGQTTSYGAGSDGDVQAGATLSYQDNFDGTITDLNTGLMWEKKIQSTGGSVNCTDETGTCANPHNADNRYTWTSASPAHDGAVVTIFLDQLNNRCNLDTTVPCTVDGDCTVPGGACGFAGHRDWRLPNVKELVGIVDFENVSPSIAAAFNGASCGGGCTDLVDPACSCTQSFHYWSSSTSQVNPSDAWFVSFSAGNTNAILKTGNYYVRAVRAGS